jgi:glycosyltransferase involved in cell wall biosynthesis
MESLASGRPVVSTTVGGIPELVTDRCGIHVPPRELDPLTAALDRALDRSWDTAEIAARSGRGWDSAAAETYEACCRAAGIPA